MRLAGQGRSAGAANYPDLLAADDVWFRLIRALAGFPAGRLRAGAALTGPAVFLEVTNLIGQVDRGDDGRLAEQAAHCGGVGDPGCGQLAGHLLRGAAFSRAGSGTTVSSAGGGACAPVKRPAQSARTSFSGLFSTRPPRYSAMT